VAKWREIVWTPGARNDLDEIVTYITRDSSSSAIAFLEEVLNSSESLMTLSERGRIVPELADPQVRELFVKSYRLFYEIQQDEVHVLGILHGAREFKRRQA
jgi:toxin ParE1/3/4